MTDDSTDLLRRAVALQQQGDPAAAEAAYRRILASDPCNPNALHLLGLIALQCGNTEEAVRLIGEAIAVVPDQPHLHSNLGAAQRAAGRPEDALRSYERAIALRSDYAEAHNNRGIALELLGRPREALACYDRAIALAPDYAEAFFNRGNARRALSRDSQALTSYDRAITLRPGYVEALNNRGDLLLSLERHADALNSLDDALARRPDYVEALYNRGNVLQALNRYEEALIAYDRAIALRPGHAEALNQRGSLFLALNRHDEALASCDRSIALRPDWPDPLCSRGVALQILGRHEEATECFGRTLALEPDAAVVHTNRSLSWLALGDYPTGWREYEWRWQTPMLRDSIRRFRAPRWVDQPDIAGKTILLHAEQGLGDTLQFCRYVPLVSAQAKVVLAVPPLLRRLLATLEGGACIVDQREKLPPFDLYCPLLSLPLALGTTVETIPATVPYLRADPEATELWRERLAALPGLRVGIAWAGGLRRHDPLLRAIDQRRSMMLGHFAPLAALPGVSLVSLQKGDPAAQAHPPPSGIELHDWTDELEDFADTAALVAALDLVITVDTAVAHVAGALGRPVWILNRFDACWRWLPPREESPWYPTARLFRQPVPGDWESVITGVCNAMWEAGPPEGLA